MEDENDDDEPKSRYQEERHEQIKAHLASDDISEDERKRWNDVKRMTQERRNLYAKELGRNQRASSPPTVDPSANSEDQLARYQYEDTFEDDSIRQETLSDEEGDEDKEASFESQLRDKNDTRDWFGTDDSKANVMDTNQDPWGATDEKENADYNPGFANFDAFENSSNFANFDSPANTSNTSNTSVEEADFCPPSCSSPSAEEMQIKGEVKEYAKEDEDDKDVKMEFESATKTDEDSHDLAPYSGEHSESSTEEVKTVNAKHEATQDPDSDQSTEATTPAPVTASPASDKSIPNEDKPATPPPTSGPSTSSD